MRHKPYRASPHHLTIRTLWLGVTHRLRLNQPDLTLPFGGAGTETTPPSIDDGYSSGTDPDAPSDAGGRDIDYSDLDEVSPETGVTRIADYRRKGRKIIPSPTPRQEKMDGVNEEASA